MDHNVTNLRCETGEIPRCPGWNAGDKLTVLDLVEIGSPFVFLYRLRDIKARANRLMLGRPHFGNLPRRRSELMKLFWTDSDYSLPLIAAFITFCWIRRERDTFANMGEQILVPIKGMEDQCVELPDDAFSEDPSAILGVLQNEKPPLDVWWRCAVCLFCPNFVQKCFIFRMLTRFFLSHYSCVSIARVIPLAIWRLSPSLIRIAMVRAGLETPLLHLLLFFLAVVLVSTFDAWNPFFPS